MIYNEEWFLPHFLAHHRALAGQRFIFFNDGSTDRTRDYLFAQDDCAVVEQYGDAPKPRLAEMQRTIGNYVLKNFGRGDWGLTLDVDEFVILPPFFKTLQEFTRYLDARQVNCSLAAMVDFYPAKLSDRFYDPLPPLVGSRWFDRLQGFRRPKDGEPFKIAFAGVRARLLEMLVRRYPDKALELYGDHFYRLARLWKVPLVNTSSDVQRVDPHTVTVPPPEKVQFALAHIKFYPGLDERIREALSRQSHFLASIEYRFLQTVIELFPDEPLIGPKTEEYKSPEDLARYRLVYAR